MNCPKDIRTKGNEITTPVTRNWLSPERRSQTLLLQSTFKEVVRSTHRLFRKHRSHYIVIRKKQYPKSHWGHKKACGGYGENQDSGTPGTTPEP